MIKIWFNHWFSAAYNIIELLKRDNPDYYIIGSNEKIHSPISAVCDEWYTEPLLKGTEYVDFCVDFCRQHEIQAFLPRREMLSISQRKQDFEKIGTKVMVEDYDESRRLNYKDQAYEELKGLGVSSIPDYYIVRTVKDFEAAYKSLADRYKEVCIKFVYDEGGKSFRLIDNNRCGYSALFKKQNTRMTYQAIVDALSERDIFSPLMVMPYLSGDEISVDCLDTELGLIMLPRIKDATRIERMCFDDEILSLTEEVYHATSLKWPCNIQFKKLDGKLFFLEVNTRMSGGVQMACLATGVNIPSIAVNKLLGKELPWKIDRRECFVTHVETPIVM